MANDDGSGKTGYKVLAALSAVVAALVARKSLTFAWTKITGTEPPKNPEDPEVTWQEAMSWAILSGVAVGVARLAAQRKVAATWRKSTGSLPPTVDRERAA